MPVSRSSSSSLSGKILDQVDKVFSGTRPEVAAAVGLGVGILTTRLMTSYLRYRKSLYSRKRYEPGNSPSMPPKQLPTFGEKIHVFDPAQLESAYHLMISTVTPRPIALVGSRNPHTGKDNLSPFSYFNAVAHDPPMLAIGFCRQGNGNQKDTLVNLQKTRQCTVNIMSQWYLDAANHSCGNWPSDMDEFVISGLRKGDCEVVQAYRVEEAAVSFECQLEYIHPLKNADGKATTEVCLLRVVRAHVDDAVLDVNASTEGRPWIDTTKLQPMGRLGGNVYSTLGELVDIPRPRYQPPPPEEEDTTTGSHASA